MTIIFMAALCNRAGHYIFALWFLSSFFLSFSFFLAHSQRSEIGCLPYFHTWCGLSANLECRSEMCCRRLAENTGFKKSPFGHHRTALSGYIFATKEHINNRKNLLSSNISSTRPHNMAIFGPLGAEIVSLVWGTPANFNGFRVLASLLHGTPVFGVSQTLRRWTEGATYIWQGGHHAGIGPHSGYVCITLSCVRLSCYSYK